MTRQTHTERRAQIDVSTAVTIIVGLMVMGLLAAFLLPVAVDELAGPTSETVTIDNSTTEQINPHLSITLDDVNQTADPDEVDVTLTNTDDSSTQTITGLAEGSNSSVTLSGDSITVTNDEVVDSDTATLTVEYPADYAWGSGAQSLWRNLDLILVLAAFLFVVGIALAATGRL